MNSKWKVKILKRNWDKDRSGKRRRQTLTLCISGRNHCNKISTLKKRIEIQTHNFKNIEYNKFTKWSTGLKVLSSIIQTYLRNDRGLRRMWLFEKAKISIISSKLIDYCRVNKKVSNLNKKINNAMYHTPFVCEQTPVRKLNNT